MGHVDVGHLLEVDDLAVDDRALALAGMGQGVEEGGELLGFDRPQDRIGVAQDPLELEAADGLLDDAVVPEEGTLGFVAARVDVDELLAEERLGSDRGRGADRDLLALVQGHVHLGLTVDQVHAGHQTDVEPVDLHVRARLQALAGGRELGLQVVLG